MKATLRKVGDVLIQAQRILGVVMAVSVALIIVIQVLLRYVFKAPLMSIEEILIFPTIWLYMIGASNASQYRNHIECGILTLYIKKERSIRIYEFLKSLISLVICGWINYWFVIYFQYCVRKWQYSAILHIPLVFAQCAMTAGLILMLVFCIRDLITDTKKLTDYFRKVPEKGDAA